MAAPRPQMVAASAASGAIPNSNSEAGSAQQSPSPSPPPSLARRSGRSAGGGHQNGPRQHVLEPAILDACGYESPNEENQSPFFSQQSQQNEKHAGDDHAPRPARPALLPRPSHMVAFSPSNHSPANGSSLGDVMSKADKYTPGQKVGIKDRIACYQWTWFTMTMSTGGIANVLYSLNSQAEWLTGFGLFFFLLNICLFLMNCACISYRFYLRPGSFIHSFTDQVESLFIPSFFVSIAIIMINICEYGIDAAGPWLLRTMEIMFWIYVALSLFASAGIYLILWSTLVFPVHMMTPTWVFPAYPLLLTAPFAGQLIAADQRSPDANLPINKTAVALAATTTQGTGCLIAFMISAAFMYRLMTQKLPRDMQRPGVFMSIGPFGFTAAGIAQLGSQAKLVIPPGFLGSEYTVDIIKVVSVLVALWLWGLAMWFFLISVGSLWKYIRRGSSMPFQMTWYSFIFPNTALITATESLGEIFQSNGIHIFGSVMTVAIIIVWIIVFLTMLRHLQQKKLLWPKDSS